MTGLNEMLCEYLWLLLPSLLLSSSSFIINVYSLLVTGDDDLYPVHCGKKRGPMKLFLLIDYGFLESQKQM